ncbi:hypothetical protein ACJX0J_031560, partial [Zea mays]
MNLNTSFIIARILIIECLRVAMQRKFSIIPIREHKGILDAPKHDELGHINSNMLSIYGYLGPHKLYSMPEWMGQLTMLIKQMLYNNGDEIHRSNLKFCLTSTNFAK